MKDIESSWEKDQELVNKCWIAITELVVKCVAVLLRSLESSALVACFLDSQNPSGKCVWTESVGTFFFFFFFFPPCFPPWLIWLSLPMFQWLSGIHRSLITSSNWRVWYDHLTFLFFPVRLKENCSVIMHCEARMHRKSPIVFTLLNKISQHTAITVVVEKINTMQQCLCLTEQ